jgi:hypothetical protein
VTVNAAVTTTAALTSLEPTRPALRRT